MIFYNEMIMAAQDNKPHNFEFIAKGDEYRNGGYYAVMKNTIVTSSFHSNSSFNLKSLKSGQIRKVYTILITRFDGKKVIY